jgi:hypothetical protein
VDPGADGIGILEDVTKTGGNMTGTPVTHDGSTDQNSEFGDDLAIISNTPLDPSLDGTYSQNIFVGGFFDRNNTLHYTASDVTITNNGPTN